MDAGSSRELPSRETRARRLTIAAVMAKKKQHEVTRFCDTLPVS